MVKDVLIEHFIYVGDLELLMYLSFFLGTVIFLFGLYRFYRRWTLGGYTIRIDNFWKRVYNLIKFGFLQRKVLYKQLVGYMHTLIFVGILLLFIGTLLRALEYDIFIRVLNSRYLINNIYLIYKFFLNVGGLLAIIGIVSSLVRRVKFKSKYLPDSLEDYLILLDLLFLLVTGFILDAFSTLFYRYEWIDGYDFVGIFLAPYLKYLPNILLIYRITWISHMLVAIFSVAYIPYTKLFHIFAGGILNSFFSRLEHSSAFKHISDLEDMVDKGGIPGAGTLMMLDWKERMDYDACIKCARCTDNCPATLSGKPLNPMDLMLKLRFLMDINEYDSEIVPHYVEEDIIWSCVTCGACVYECPMLIHHVETIIDIRRYLLGKSENIPEEAVQLSYNVMRYGNPNGYDPNNRSVFVEELIKQIGVEHAREDVEYEYIYWLGCQSTYDPVNKNTVKSLLTILKKSGVKVAILPEENCCGEPVRRIGDELLFKELINMNKELLSKYKFKKLIVNCPHGYNVFKYEYPLYGYNLDVVHHSVLLKSLIQNGKLKLQKIGNVHKVTYHDPCYLGRWNNIYDEPRDILRTLVSNNFIEMPRSREKSFCCGGGGGHLFFEIKRGNRISKMRMDEAKNTGASTLCVSCPFCKIMLNSEAGEDMEVLDISELIEIALEK